MESNMAIFLFYCGTMNNKIGFHSMSRYSFRIATEFGHIPSARELGILMLKGRGGEVDIYEGSRLLHMAEQSGDTTASLILDSYLDF